MKIVRTPTRNHPYRFMPARQDSSPPFYAFVEPSGKARVGPSASYSAPIRPQDTNKVKQTSRLPDGLYAFASSRHKSGRDWRNLLGRQSHSYEDTVATTDDDDDIEMQAPRQTRESLLEQQHENQSQHQSQHEQQYEHHQQGPYHDEGAGMGYDDDGEDGKQAWIEVGTAKEARITLVPAGSVSITNIGRGKAAVVVPWGESQSVRDVFSLPDLAWAETLTTGGGRRPGAMVPLPIPPMAASAPAIATAGGTAHPLSPSKSSSISSSNSMRSKKGLQERSESRKAVKRKAIREWCARGSGGGLGPYSAAY
ncbi:hypothetical protein DHEL01_v203696 [Diaporthe helianthi]|uniref:Uncharacterized protein n=1 Tax=Diaporthe helianthi TaxID=158607 RepID=A0A2P5I5Z1_DIAHE|nr:hypothetical protein DHEL01_v203696 [Diaporthe helianthi]